MYTDEMAKSFHAIEAPGDFKVDLYDNGQFITIVVDPKSIVGISEAEAEGIVNYINSVKKMLESFGALVLVSRDEVSE
jgi:hypothetical protein